MWYILVCHPQLTIILRCTTVWVQACGLGNKTSFVIIVHLWFIWRLHLFVVVVGWEQYHDTAISGIDILTFETVTTLVQCGLVNMLQYHDIDDFCVRLRDGRSTTTLLSCSTWNASLTSARICTPIMPSGGTAMFQGTGERVTKEPTASAPSTINFPMAFHQSECGRYGLEHPS